MVATHIVVLVTVAENRQQHLNGVESAWRDQVERNVAEVERRKKTNKKEEEETRVVAEQR